MSTSNYTVIANMLKRFNNVILSKEDYETTVKDILWNVVQIKDTNESNKPNKEV